MEVSLGTRLEPLTTMDLVVIGYSIALLVLTCAKVVEILIDMVWTIYVGARFESAVRSEIDARGSVNIGDIESDFRRIQPVYRILEHLALRTPSLARLLRAIYWAPGLATSLALASIDGKQTAVTLPLLVACTSFTTLVLVNAPLRRFSLRGYDRYNRDLLIGAWRRPGDTTIQSDQALRAVSAYFLWLVYVSVVGFSASYGWASKLDSMAFTTTLAFPSAIFFSLGVVSTVGFITATAQSTTAQVLVATQVTTGPLILAWLLSEVAPHHRAERDAVSLTASTNVSKLSNSAQALVAALIINDEGKFLLGHRRRTESFRPNTWDLIGGHVENGEDPRRAVIREVYEEIGVRLGQVSEEPDARWIEDGYDLRIWFVRDWSGRPRNFSRGQHRSIRFFSTRQARRVRLGDPKYRALFQTLESYRDEP